MRFLVADDVLLARKAIEKLIMEWNGDSVICGSCGSGDEAVKILEAQPVDVVITDIRMPGLGGIALSQLVQERFPEVTVIYVSGYAEFEYARCAIHYGVQEYLLKPLKKEELFEALNSISSEGKEREIQRKLVEEAQEKAEGFLLLRYLLGWEQPDGKRLAELSYRGLDPLAGEEAGYLFAAYMVREADELVQLAACREKWADRGDLLFEDVLHWGVGFICFCGLEGVAFHKKKRMLEAMAYGENREGKHITMGVSQLLKGPEAMRTAYSQARRAVCLRLVRPDRQVHFFDDGEEGGELFSRKELYLVKCLLAEGRYQKAREYCENKFLLGSKAGIATLEQSYQALVGLCVSVENAGEGKAEECIGRPLWSFRESGELLAFLFSMLRSGGKPDEIGRGNQIVEEIQAFLEENYYCEISLNELAATRYYINPNYLSRLFKAQTGMGFSRYLLNLRMKKAKQLIMAGELTIQEVALMVGYTSPSYFIQNYKKFFGETPGARRNKGE